MMKPALLALSLLLAPKVATPKVKPPAAPTPAPVCREDEVRLPTRLLIMGPDKHLHEVGLVFCVTPDKKFMDDPTKWAYRLGMIIHPKQTDPVITEE